MDEQAPSTPTSLIRVSYKGAWRVSSGGSGMLLVPSFIGLPGVSFHSLLGTSIRSVIPPEWPARFIMSTVSRNSRRRGGITSPLARSWRTHTLVCFHCKQTLCTPTIHVVLMTCSISRLVQDYLSWSFCHH